MIRSKLLVVILTLFVALLVLAACGGRGAGEEEAPAESMVSGGSTVNEETSTDEAAVTEERAAAEVAAAAATSMSAPAGNEVKPPQTAEPCQEGSCPFAGQTVSVLVPAGGVDGPISGPLHEIRDEFEAATGASLEIVEVPFAEHFPRLMTDLATGSGRYDASIGAAWWLGDLVEGEFILSYDEWYGDDRFPEWDVEDVDVGPRGLLSYDEQKYMVANDIDGQIMYYRRDLFGDANHQTAFEEAYGYPLEVPHTWNQFRDIAEYFDGQDLNGDGEPDDGLAMHVKAGSQALFQFMSLSAPYVIGPENPTIYWFDPEDMTPLLDSPGHVRALETLVGLTEFGPEAMMGWSFEESWDHFLQGRAALTFTWGDLGGLAQAEDSQIKGIMGAAPVPGTDEYYNVAAGEWVETDQPNVVGNTAGGLWSGVISRFSDAPEATYFLLALMSTKEKSLVYAARGWDGVDIGRFSHYLPPTGTADIDDYLAAGWDEQDIFDYTQAYADNFGASNQFPYLRIPGTNEYWTALDRHLSSAMTGQSTPEDALANIVVDFDTITDRLGREAQLQSYRNSLELD